MSDEQENVNHEVQEATAEVQPQVEQTVSANSLNIQKEEVPETFNYKELQSEYDSTGSLSDKSKAKLHKLGFDDEAINDFIQGNVARRELAINKIAECIGGRETFNKVLEWAGKNLDKEEIIEINSVKSTYAQKMILQDLKKRMDEKEGTSFEKVKGTGAAPKTVEVFESQAQMLKAVNSDEYKSDPAFRAKTAAKIAASRKAGINLGF